MPALRYCSHTGAQKARVAAMSIGETIVASSLPEAASLRTAAKLLGLRVSVYRIARKNPAHAVKLCARLYP